MSAKGAVWDECAGSCSWRRMSFKPEAVSHSDSAVCLSCDGGGVDRAATMCLRASQK
jgi:hypothetical protein